MSDNLNFISLDNKNTVTEAIKTTVESRFCEIELVEVKFYKEYGSHTLELLLWSKEGITLNDCEAVHGVVSEVLDGYDDIFECAYNLKVSSMGLDRPIVTDDDFRRALNIEIECRDSNKSRHHGVLTGFDAENIVLNDGKKSVTLKRNILTKVQPYIRF